MGFLDSREYLGDTDDDYVLKHFFLIFDKEEEELRIEITVETSEGLYGETSGTGTWPCYSKEDKEALKSIFLKGVEGLRFV